MVRGGGGGRRLEAGPRNPSLQGLAPPPLNISYPCLAQFSVQTTCNLVHPTLPNMAPSLFSVQLSNRRTRGRPLAGAQPHGRKLPIEASHLEMR